MRRCCCWPMAIVCVGQALAACGRQSEPDDGSDDFRA